MGINPLQLRDFVIRPLLKDLDEKSQVRNSPFAEALLLATAAHESHFEYLAQEQGPARGIYQMEPRTVADLYDNYIAPKYVRWQFPIESSYCAGCKPFEQLTWNLRFAT